MTEKLILLIFLGAVVFSLLISVIVFYHFKKFMLKDDNLGPKILKIFIIGNITILFLTFLSLLFIII
jgi:hypothetical protein